MYFYFSYYFFQYFHQSFSSENKSEVKFVGCNNSVQKDNLNLDSSKNKKIEVDVHKYRDWTVNGIRILTNRSRFVTEEYKRRFDATITVNYDSGLNVFSSTS